MLTTVSTVGGLLPLALGGGTLWGPMGNVIIFGLSIATVLTLVVIPVVYEIVERGTSTGRTQKAPLPEP